ncbi:helix-turn-helix domain-containing protein, partial [Candidatus Methanocrinis natronophilus]
MVKAFRYRIYPTKAQRSKMEETLELCRWTY